MLLPLDFLENKFHQARWIGYKLSYSCGKQ